MSALQLKSTGGNESLPKIEIPDGAWRADGQPSFSLKTPAGRVSVGFDYYHRELELRGSPDALAACGVFRPAWAPDPTGMTNKSSQAVVFTPDGPALVVGRFLRDVEEYPYLIVYRVGSKFHVHLPLTPEQEDIHETKDQESRARKEAERTHPKARTDDDDADWANINLSADGLHMAKIALAGVHLDKIKEELMPRFGFAYSAMSEARILRAIGELHRAFVEARIVSVVPKYQTSSNVIGWPGRGRVSAVLPSALQ
jgi:hypothetical protein